MEEKQTVAFILGTEEYGIEISKVQEIIRIPQNRTKLPNSCDFHLGVTNLRGNVIPIIDLKMKFMGIATEFTDESRVIVIEVGAGKIGLVVDEVLEVIKFSSEIIEKTNSINTGFESDFLLGLAKLDERLLIMLDVEKILN